MLTEQVIKFAVEALIVGQVMDTSAVGLGNLNRDLLLDFYKRVLCFIKIKMLKLYAEFFFFSVDLTLCVRRAEK
jgi:hypothetical protein